MKEYMFQNDFKFSSLLSLKKLSKTDRINKKNAEWLAVKQAVFLTSWRHFGDMRFYQKPRDTVYSYTKTAFSWTKIKTFYPKYAS